MQGGDLSAVDSFLLNLINIYLNYLQQQILDNNNFVPEQRVLKSNINIIKII